MAQTVLERMKARERRDAERETLQRAVQQAILTRFPDAPSSLTDRVERLRKTTDLEALLGRAILASSPEEIEALLGP